MFGGVCQLVAVQCSGGRLARHALATPPARCRVAAVQDLQQGPAGELGVGMGLHEPAGSHPSAELGATGVLHGSDGDITDRPVLDVRVGPASREQPQEVTLAGAVGAQHGDPLAEPDFQVERLHQTGQLEVGADHGPLAGPAAA